MVGGTESSASRSESGRRDDRRDTHTHDGSISQNHLGVGLAGLGAQAGQQSEGGGARGRAIHLDIGRRLGCLFVLMFL